MRRKATPEMPEELLRQLPAAPAASGKAVSFTPRRAAALSCAAVVFAAVLVGGGIRFLRTPSLLPGGDTSGTPGASDTSGGGSSDVTPEIPVRQTVVQTVALAGISVAIEVPTYGKAFTFDYGIGGTLDEHFECSGVVYSSADGTVFCAKHALAVALDGKVKGELTVKNVCLPLGRILFTAGKNSYFYDLNTKELTKVGLDLTGTATRMSGDSTELEQPFCTLEGSDRSGAVFYLVSMKDRTVEDLQKAGADGKKRPVLDTYSQIAKGGRFAQYVLDDSKCHTPERTNVLIDLTTREVHTFTGEFCDSTPDGRYFVAQTNDGLTAYDTEARRQSAFADSGCPQQYRYGLKLLRRYRDGYCSDFALLDRQTGETTKIDGHPSDAVIGYDGTVAYVFDREKTVIDGYDFLQGEWFTVALPDDLVSLLRASGQKEISAYLRGNADGSVTLSYRVFDTTERFTPEQELELERKYPGATWDAMVMEDKVTSLLSLRPILERFFADEPQKLYRGDGFAMMDVTGFDRRGEYIVRSSHRFYAIEDYTNGWFYLLGHTADKDEVWGSAKLPADAAQRTAKMAQELSLPTVDGAVLPCLFLKDGKVDQAAQDMSRLDVAYIFDGGAGFIITPTNFLDSTGSQGNDPEELRKFLTYVCGLSFAEDKAVASSMYAYITSGYWVHVFRHSNGEDMEFKFGQTRKVDYAVLYRGRYLATMTAEDYAKWKAWADEAFKVQQSHN